MTIKIITHLHGVGTIRVQFNSLSLSQITNIGAILGQEEFKDIWNKKNPLCYVIAGHLDPFVRIL